ncbi:MAG TPA: ATP-binding protein, partial [Pyrinomonadaceae bacterium]|nr:ATP-binding protein [Pyrinomonadaceae bacterium]
TAVETGRASDERWHLRKDGSRFFASGVLTVLGDNAQNGFVKILRDLTERKLFEDTLREADRRKDEFLATLAHELRNPLAPIRLALEIMRRGESKKKGLEARDIISRQTEQIVDLVDDLLDISRISQGKIKLRKNRVDLREAVKSALEAAQPMIDTSEHKLTVSTPEEPIFIEGDFTRLSQIFTNILANAAKYTKPGGKIYVNARMENGNAVVRVKDTGLGIPKEMLPHIFDMFMQVQYSDRRSQGGLGIGLSLVKRLVEMHGGTVYALSEGADKGSEFIVTLPAAERQTPSKKEAKSAEKEPADSPSVKPKRILVVDDNADAAQVLCFALQLEGHDVSVAYDGKSAIKAAEEFQPQICLLDIGLPDIDGFKVARQIREKMSETLLVAITGWGQEEDRRRSQKAGFDYHLVKPVAIEDIIELMVEK